MKSLALLISLFVAFSANAAGICEGFLTTEQLSQAIKVPSDPFLIQGKSAEEVYQLMLMRKHEGVEETTRIVESTKEQIVRVSSFTKFDVVFYRIETESIKTGRVKLQYSLELGRASLKNIWRLHSRLKYGLDKNNKFRKLKQDLGFEIVGKDAKEIYVALEHMEDGYGNYKYSEDIDDGFNNFLQLIGVEAINSGEKKYWIDFTYSTQSDILYLKKDLDKLGISKNNLFYTRTMTVAFPMAPESD